MGHCCDGRVTLDFGDEQPTPRLAGWPVLIFSAGDVGRALATALNSLPLSPRLIDERATELALAALGISTTPVLFRKRRFAPRRPAPLM
jgi:xanthine dehydrogenase accessory factor